MRVLSCVIAALVFVSGPSLADDSITYDANIIISWTEQNYPLDFPKNPHFSRFFGVSHNSKVSLFRDGTTASSGLSLLATNGRTSVLKAEFAEAQRRGRAGMMVEHPGLKATEANLIIRFEVSEDHQLFSFATMLAPSPDWIAGVSNVKLRVSGEWIKTLTLPIFVWDAGVDAGSTYNASNRPNQPKESTRLAAGPMFVTEAGIAPIGSVTFSRRKDMR